MYMGKSRTKISNREKPFWQVSVSAMRDSLCIEEPAPCVEDAILGEKGAIVPLHSQVGPEEQDAELGINPVYVRVARREIPRYKLPAEGMLPDTALQVVRDELILDGNARLNLATFVTTWMEPQAAQLMAECFDKNMIDKDEYPQTAELERRCVNILGNLWHAPAGSQAPGCSTTGSSEGCMLGGMALLWRWRARRGAAAGQPNLVMGTNVQVCWEKFCRYWQVEPRMVPMEPGRLHLTGPEAAAVCDENTIGVVAPFLHPDLEWDFRVPRVQSINSSGHKYGLVYPGVGWIVWREREALPEDLVFKVNYLGGEMPTFALNFSRPGSQVAAQYYNFIRLGFSGYRRIQQTCQDIALHLSGEIAKIGPFELLTDGSDLPVFA